jgi:RimJ/RimL family protein N-acetyltransferase
VEAPYVEGEKVRLRPLARADAPRLVTLLHDAEVRRFLRAGAPPTLALEEALIDALPRAHGDLLAGVVARDDGRPVGAAGLHHLDDPARKAELGIFIGPAREWGRGFGTEATALLVRHAFDGLGLHRVWLHVHADHPRAIAAYERVGFRSEGVLRESALRDGKLVDVVSMGILRGELRGR